MLTVNNQTIIMKIINKGLGDYVTKPSMFIS